MITVTDVTRAGAWLQAAKLLHQRRDVAYNFIVEITQPATATSESRAIETTVDQFLRLHRLQPLHTVAETIFPAAEYRLHGLAGVYDYAKQIHPTIRLLQPNLRGTYAQRLVERACSDGSTVRPLELLINKLRTQLKLPGPLRAVYELDTGLEPLELKFYEPEVDHSNTRGGQCLSHLSLKLGPNRELYMTAVYRYQYYLQKALGNFKGLARLQACIAQEVDVPVGPLVCHATLAALETDAVGRHQVSGLLEKCAAINSARTEESAA